MTESIVYVWKESDPMPNSLKRLESDDSERHMIKRMLTMLR